MDFTKRYTKLLKQQKLQIREQLFPYCTKFLDKRIDAYLSLFYECDLYDLYELCKDLCEVLYVKQSFLAEVRRESSPLEIESNYLQLTLF